MTPKPLGEIGLFDHRSALWWLGLLYRKPKQFKESLSGLGRGQALLTGIGLLHSLPYMLLLVVLGRWLLFGVLGLETIEPVPTVWPDLLIWHGSIIAFGIVFGIVFGIASGIASGIAFGTAVGTAVGIAVGTAEGIVLGFTVWTAVVIAYGIVDGIAVGIALGIVFGIVLGISAGTVAVVDSGVAIGIASGIAVAVALPTALLRAYYWPFTLAFVWPRLKPHWYPYHPVAWDDLCSIPFPRLDSLLAAYAEIEPLQGQQEIRRLIDDYPAQRMTGLRAQTRLVARQSGRESNLSQLGKILLGLPEGDKGFLKWTGKIILSTQDISDVQDRLSTQLRPFLREPTAALLVEKLKNLHSQIAGYPEPLASEFRPAVANWLKIAESQHYKIVRIANQKPTPQVFRAGDPVDRGQEAFVPREMVLEELDQQLTLATGCPGLIVYGRRRTGKSTLLSNLEGFIPETTRVARVSMQNPDLFTSQAMLLERIAQELLKVCPEAKPTAVNSVELGRHSGMDRRNPDCMDATETHHPWSLGSGAPCRNDGVNLGSTKLGSEPAPTRLSEFFALLTACNEALKSNGLRLLLAIDEYENIDEKIGLGVFNEDLLATLRESIQYHRQIIWAFAGSRAIEELTNAPWSSYLISARTVEIPPFSLAETKRLLTEPLRYSKLWKDDDPKRPRFEPGFWGDGGIERIQHEAGGWPHLVQLLAEGVVDLCNMQGRRSVDADLLEQAMDKATVRGDTVLRQLLQGEASEAEWTYLSGFRRADTQPIPEDEAVYRGLRRRLLVEEAGPGLWRLRVPLMQRWLRARG